ncbi:MAG: hypothetical protein KDC65_16310, partial [Saprospiraceae bacterium]|nr:hypothetical protein [Saprospiraceae bacterium]
LLKIVWEFREVVITCRTQFFPTQKEEPHETGYFTGGDSGEYKFQKLYLSVFDDKDVRKYLRKRFALLNPFTYRKLRRAHEIAKKSPNLVVRPMLLSRIEDLVNTDKEFKFSFQIYETLIDSWMERESKKPGIKQKHGSEENYREKLYSFSQSLAVDLYQNRDRRGGYFIPKGESFGDQSGLQLADIEEASLTETEKRSRSLLNRNAIGDYKFSHKSILEYFLAKKMLNDPEFYQNFDFEGMEAAKRFSLEMLVAALNETLGQFSLTTDAKRKQPLSGLGINDLEKVKWLNVQQLSSFNILRLQVFSKVKILILTDVGQYKLLYLLYITFLPYMLNRLDMIALLDRLDYLGVRYLRNRLLHIDVRDLYEMLGLRGLLLEIELEDPKSLLSLSDYLYKQSQSLQSLHELNDLLVLRNRLDPRDFRNIQDRLENGEPETLVDLISLNIYLNKVMTLQSLLPNCKIYY